MEPNRAQQRIVAYDALRVFAIVTVVGIHTLMPYREIAPDASAVRVLDDLLHYAVPLFVFISGALLWSRPWQGGPGAYRTFIARRVSLIGAPYVAWSTVFLGLRYVTEPTPLAEVPGLLLSGHTWYHLYFVPMLLTFYLVTPLASRLAIRAPAAFVAGAYLARIVAGPAVAAAVGEVLGEYGWAWATHVMTHLPHMALGAWFALRLGVLPSWLRRSWPLLLALGTAVLAAASVGATADLALPLRRLVYPLGMAATVLGFALAAFAFESTLERATRLIVRGSALAFGVYFVHPLFLLAIDGVVSAGPGMGVWRQPWMPLGVFAAVTALSYAASALLARTRATAWLVGVRPASRGT